MDVRDAFVNEFFASIVPFVDIGDAFNNEFCASLVGASFVTVNNALYGSTTHVLMVGDPSSNPSYIVRICYIFNMLNCAVIYINKSHTFDLFL